MVLFSTIKIMKTTDMIYWYILQSISCSRNSKEQKEAVMHAFISYWATLHQQGKSSQQPCFSSVFCFSISLQNPFVKEMRNVQNKTNKQQQKHKMLDLSTVQANFRRQVRA